MILPEMLVMQEFNAMLTQSDSVSAGSETIDYLQRYCVVSRAELIHLRCL